MYVSLDAPHQGANVPLGYQAAARHATRMYISTGPIAATAEIIQLIRNGPSPLLNLLLSDQPASKQMLINRIDLFYNEANTVNQQFLQELRTQWAYPVNIRNIAISNGSECAIDQEFAAGSSLLYHYRSTKTRFIGDLIFMVAGLGLEALNVSPLITIPFILPGSSKFELTLDIKAIASGGGNSVYYGNIAYTKKVLWLIPIKINIANKTYNAPTGILPFDNYPGGFFTLRLANQPGSVSQDWMFSYNNSFYIQRRFSFIPTTSSLDIGLGNTTLTNTNYLAKYIGATPPAVPFNTPFVNFATAFNQNGTTWIFDNSNFRKLNNEPHEGLLIRNANWLADEMNGVNTVRTNCDAFCSNGVIAGPAIICTTETFTAPFGVGVNYDWQCTPTGAVTFSGSGNTRQITRNINFNGNATITVAMSGACGDNSLNKTVRLGAYTASEYYIIPSSSAPFCRNQTVQFGIGWWMVPDAPYYNWVWSGANYVTGQGTRGISLQMPTTVYYNPTVSVGLSVGNACGISSFLPFSVYSINPNCYSSSPFRVSPNPAPDNIKIDPAIDAGTGVTLSQPADIVEVEIIDKMGLAKLKKRIGTGVKVTNINIGTLPSDVYTLRIFDGHQWHSHKIIIQH